MEPVNLWIFLRKPTHIFSFILLRTFRFDNKTCATINLISFAMKIRVQKVDCLKCFKGSRVPITNKLYYFIKNVSLFSEMPCDRLYILIFFCLNWLIFLLLTDLERNSQLSQIVRNKGKNILIKMVSKWKRVIRKGHTSFFGFDFWY